MDSKDSKQSNKANESLPSYSEVATTSNPTPPSSSSNPTATPPPILHGQSPYQSTETSRITILPTSTSHRIELLTSSSEARREIRSRTANRFWRAFFWAFLIWAILSLLSGGIVSEAVKEGRDRKHHNHRGGDWNDGWIEIKETDGNQYATASV